ncbi:MAG TPA: hypothetical protein VJK02_03105 [Anaerolineales bacterium]|nr:hypothetical protein [Anaerolineales bacterium]
MNRRLVAATIAGLLVTVLGCNFGRSASPSPEKPVETATDQPPASSGFSLVVLHPSDGDLAGLLAAHAARAIEMGRRPFVEVSAEWCPSCVALDNSLTDDLMVDAFEGTYLVRLDIDEWSSRLPGTGFRVLGVPTFFEVGEDGMPTGRVLTGAAWGEDIPENMAPCLKEFYNGQ